MPKILINKKKTIKNVFECFFIPFIWLFCIFIHELGHFVVYKFLGCNVTIQLSFFGGTACWRGNVTQVQNLIGLLMGPIFGISFSFLLFLIFRLLKLNILSNMSFLLFLTEFLYFGAVYLPTSDISRIITILNVNPLIPFIIINTLSFIVIILWSNSLVNKMLVKFNKERREFKRYYENVMNNYN